MTTAIFAWSVLEKGGEFYMKCPRCGGGEIYVHTPIVYRYDVADDGSIVETGVMSDIMVVAGSMEDVALCNECETEFPIYENKVIVEWRKLKGER